MSNPSVSSPAKIYLASGSPRRQELLRGIGLTIEVRPSNVDEHVESSLVHGRFVEVLAERKALHVAAEIHSLEKTPAIVIGADTVVTLDQTVLGKPASRAHAIEMLMQLQGRVHTVYTGLCVVSSDGAKKCVGHTATDVWMRPFSEETAARYADTGEPMDKAGAYGIQGMGSTLITQIKGDYFTVVGLPLHLVATYLREFGVSVL